MEQPRHQAPVHVSLMRGICVAEDGFDVRLKAREIGDRDTGRVVGLIVDGLHLIARADGPQGLGGAGTE